MEFSSEGVLCVEHCPSEQKGQSTATWIPNMSGDSEFNLCIISLPSNKTSSKFSRASFKFIQPKEVISFFEEMDQKPDPGSIYVWNQNISNLFFRTATVGCS